MGKQIFNTSDFIAFVVTFDQANYKDRLSLWESELNFQNLETHRMVSLKALNDQQLTSLNESIFVTPNKHTAQVTLSIKPKGSTEVASYNEWVITQWRKHYTTIDRKNTYLKLLPPYRTFESLKAGLLTKTANCSKSEQALLLTELHNRLFEEINRTPHKELLMSTYQLFLTEDENDIFGAEYPERTSALLKLRIIGRFWDKLKFMAFIDKERKKLKVSQINSPFEIITLSPVQMELLFSELRAKNFIPDDSCKISFLSMLKQEPVKTKIRWIDKSTKNDEFNKGTLITFIRALETNKLGNNGSLFKFIRTYFEIEKGVEIAYLPQANQDCLNRNQVSHPRYKELEKILNKVTSIADTLMLR